MKKCRDFNDASRLGVVVEKQFESCVCVLQYVNLIRTEFRPETCAV
jgi:hypothetical protein